MPHVGDDYFDSDSDGNWSQSHDDEELGGGVMTTRSRAKASQNGGDVRTHRQQRAKASHNGGGVRTHRKRATVSHTMAEARETWEGLEIPPGHRLADILPSSKCRPIGGYCLRKRVGGKSRQELGDDLAEQERVHLAKKKKQKR